MLLGYRDCWQGSHRQKAAVMPSTCSVCQALPGGLRGSDGTRSDARIGDDIERQRKERPPVLWNRNGQQVMDREKPRVWRRMGACMTLYTATVAVRWAVEGGENATTESVDMWFILTQR